MSGSDDPWGKWRKPEAVAPEAEAKPVAGAPDGSADAGERETRATPAVDREKKPKTKSADAAPASQRKVTTTGW